MPLPSVVVIGHRAGRKEHSAMLDSRQSRAWRVFGRSFATEHVELAHNGADAVAQDGTGQPGLKGRMAAHGFHAFPYTPLGDGPSGM